MNLIEKINKFNSDFIGKKVKSCDVLNSRNLVIENNTALLCCISTTKNEPKICINKEEFDKLDKNYYIDKFIDSFYDIQKSGLACKDCSRLHETEFCPIDYDSFRINGISCGTFHSCNAKCIYCPRENDNFDLNFAIEAIMRVIETGGCGENTIIAHAYGEPTIQRDFEKCFEAVLKANATNNVLSSGLFYSDIVSNGLCQGKTSLNISVDSGTPKTYKKIKGVDGFDIVWKNIKKYCETGGDVSVKYVLLSYNSSKTDLDGFICKCVENNVKSVIVSAEVSVAVLGKVMNWEFGENELNAAAYLLERCMENGINVSLNECFTNENTKIVLNKLDDNIFKSPNEVVCIFGAGNSGLNLYEKLVEANKRIDFFCDNRKHGEINQYGIPCISVEKAIKMGNIKIIIPKGLYLTEMRQQLDNNGFKNYIVFSMG